MADSRNSYLVLVGDLGRGGGIMLKWIFRK